MTKVDKLNRREAASALETVQQALAAYTTDEADIGVSPFSALKRVGLEDVASALRQWADDEAAGVAATAT
jgi:GTP-binding protein